MLDSRLPEPGDCVRRRRECGACNSRFTTFERAEGISLGVRKRDGRLEPYDRQKLLAGLMRAVTKRPVTVAQLEAVAGAIEETIRREGGEVDAEALGELALGALGSLDPVAAIRFASVYRRFESLDEFEAELRRAEVASIPAFIGPVVDGADPAAVPSEPNGSIRRSPATPPGHPTQPGTTMRRSHAEQS